MRRLFQLSMYIQHLKQALNEMVRFNKLASSSGQSISFGLNTWGQVLTWQKTM